MSEKKIMVKCNNEWKKIIHDRGVKFCIFTIIVIKKMWIFWLAHIEKYNQSSHYKKYFFFDVLPEGGPRILAEPRRPKLKTHGHSAPQSAARIPADVCCILIKQTISDDSDVYFLIIEYESE